MSNRAVSSTYRLVIDDVIANVRQDFEDMGIEREVLEELQRSWEAKIVATGVADFDGAGPAAPRRQREQQQQQQSDTPKVKQEDDDGSLHQSQSSQQASSSSSNKVARTNGSTSVKDGTAGEGSSGNGKSRDKGTSNGGDGGDGGEGEGGKRKRPADDDEIGSDLDDSDDEDFDGALDGDGDMILCLYDKVQRVRNKWKCVLKDGVASIDGRDYVFSKLGSELEW